MVMPSPGYYRGLAPAIRRASRRGTLAEPWGVPRAWLGELPGTPGLDAGAPGSVEFDGVTRLLAGALGVPPSVTVAEFWAPVTAMGIPLETIEAQSAARGHNPEALAVWLLEQGQAWERSNLVPIAERLTECAGGNQELLAEMGRFAASWYELNGRAPLAPGLRWPTDERAALEATLAEFCGEAPPPLADPSTVAATPTRSLTPYYLAGGVGLLGAVGVGIYMLSRRKRR